ncbi:VOC family protein [Pseudoflavitalea sp. G-6-1-2]|uniref:VOC family protein n=1 Tax=Pseudoflavitalea sp. G-6-1-2 TaxID=2728841 RepID=UPI00146A6D87|nr:VOC family protein [Pseudoflavitalea sp. G-6-1-2]NML19560.1 VOC family protein [Pseudoflavitalea sp. G-6-1-2]
MQKITPMLWFNGNAEEAIAFYKKVFPGTSSSNELRSGDGLITAAFNILGQDFIALNGGPQFKFSEAVSFVVSADTQEGIDNYWNQLIADGGAEGQCGWCKDKFGLSWQIVPPVLTKLLTDKDRVKAGNVMQAMLKMKKIVIADLEAAYQAA